jgi:hypothetical protein
MLLFRKRIMELTKRVKPVYRLTKADHDLLKQLEKILKINNTLRRVFRNMNLNY